MSTSIYTDFGKWVKERRRQLGVTQKDLAKKIHCAPDTISKIEQNRLRPSLDLAKGLVVHLDIPEGEIPSFLALARHTSTPETESSTEVATVPAQPAQVKRSRFFFPYPLNLTICFSLGAVLVVGVIFYWLRANTLPLLVGSVNLVGTQNQVVVVTTGTRVVRDGDTIKVGEIVTVKFKVRNEDIHPVWIQRLVSGSNGPGGHSLEWKAPNVPYPPMDNIVLQPGQTFEYIGSRPYYDPGDYFIEPVFQDATGKWSGIMPYTRIKFFVQ